MIRFDHDPEPDVFGTIVIRVWWHRHRVTMNRGPRSCNVPKIYQRCKDFTLLAMSHQATEMPCWLELAISPRILAFQGAIEQILSGPSTGVTIWSSTWCPICHCVNRATGNGPTIGIKLLRWIQSQSCSAQGWWPALKWESCQLAKNEYAQLQVLVCLGCQWWNQAPPSKKNRNLQYCNALISHKYRLPCKIGILWQPSHLFEGQAQFPNPPQVYCDLMDFPSLMASWEWWEDHDLQLAAM